MRSWPQANRQFLLLCYDSAYRHRMHLISIDFIDLLIYRLVAVDCVLVFVFRVFVRENRLVYNAGIAQLVAQLIRNQ